MNIQGLTLVSDFIDEKEECNLIELIESQHWNKSLSRLTQHYGSEYNYKSRRLTEAPPIPDWLDLIIDKVMKTEILDIRPDQIIINRYLPGEGINAHVDNTTLFGPQICSISLGSGCKMSVGAHDFYLTQRTFLLMEGFARYHASHSITAHKIDLVRGKKCPRRIRYSITMRTVAS
jgi:alkylated DNA repair dioxygenase AlkB